MNDPVDRLLVERQRSLDSGFSRGMVTSLIGHLVLVSVAFAAPLLFPKAPPLQMADGFAVALPRGGGGDPNAGGQPPASAPEPPAPAPEPPAPAPEPPPKVLKPPKEEPKKGLPELDSRKKAKKPEKPAPSRTSGKPEAQSKAASSGSSRPGPGTNPGIPGLALGPPGPGVPEGTDSGGDWYLAGVQQKIWAIWMQQIKAGFNEPIGVTFTILADGSVTDVQVTRPSQATLLNLAAQRAILTAAPFAPLPKEYGTNRYTIQAMFRPS
jgi:TonB family protein